MIYIVALHYLLTRIILLVLSLGYKGHSDYSNQVAGYLSSVLNAY